jgi:hypothetical protein
MALFMAFLALFLTQIIAFLVIDFRIYVFIRTSSEPTIQRGESATFFARHNPSGGLFGRRNRVGGRAACDATNALHGHAEIRKFVERTRGDAVISVRLITYETC